MSLDEMFMLPAALPALAVVPVVWLALRAVDRARAARLRAVLGPRAPALAAELGPGRRRVRRALGAAGLACALVAVMQPTWGVDTRRLEQRGVDVLICLDVSRSMLARDVRPSRLERARQEIRSLAERTRGDRLGLVVFAGEARSWVPLTHDAASFADLVDAADPLAVRRGGTDLGAALEAALGALEGRNGDHAVVLLVTDGEDLEQRGLRAAEVCRDRGIVVHCAGLGSERGSKIAIQGPAGEAFLRDRVGGEVVTALDASSLRAIAATTGGTFVDATASERALVDLYEQQILPAARATYATGERRARHVRFQWPLLSALLLWLAELAIADRRRR